jgi:GTP-binding protein YchF
MGLSIGIVGLPNVGKSTLFNALTKKGVPAENYPFCTIDPSVGIVAVPDERLAKLSAFSASAKTIPGAIEFVDIAGLVEGASKGEGLGNKFLANIRETDAILEMVRLFPISGTDSTGSPQAEIAHVYGTVDPLRDISVINLELILADFETVTKRRANLVRDTKRGDKVAIAEDAVLVQIEAVLEAGALANTVEIAEEDAKMVKQLNLLTTKKFLYGLNKRSGASNLDESDPIKFKELTDMIIASDAEYVLLDAKIEDDLKDFDGAEKDEMRLAMTEVSEQADLSRRSEAEADGINNLITQAYNLLGLETFFTTGADESRAWTIKKGSTAPIAGTAIHTDFKDKFIRAEVVYWSDLLENGSYANARAKGLVRTEGKEYIVKDGDVIEFRI